VLVCGLAKPGSWRMEYEKIEKCRLQTCRHIPLMVLEWAKEGLDSNDGGWPFGRSRAAVWLSKWFSN
jgi:hypothetical protein